MGRNGEQTRIFRPGFLSSGRISFSGKHIVWDEFVGYLITMMAAPAGWLWVIVGFFLFRFFDVVKPWPVRKVDREVQGGWGIMLDDILAGVYAWLTLQILVTLILN